MYCEFYFPISFIHLQSFKDSKPGFLPFLEKFQPKMGVKVRETDRALQRIITSLLIFGLSSFLQDRSGELIIGFVLPVFVFFVQALVFMLPVLDHQLVCIVQAWVFMLQVLDHQLVFVVQALIFMILAVASIRPQLVCIV